jgi:transposase
VAFAVIPRRWLARHPRWTFHFTPTSVSWLNAVEGFFAKLTRRRLKRGVFRSLVLRHAKHHWQIPLRAKKSPRCDRTAMIRGFSRPILNS